MGHSGCGGVKAALDRAARETEGQFITKWMSMLDEARLTVLASHQGAARNEMEQALEREGIKTSLGNLRTFPFLNVLESKGRLALHGAYFEISTGQLSALNESTGQFYKL
jgi:carbonic anhydrase